VASARPARTLRTVRAINSAIAAASSSHRYPDRARPSTGPSGSFRAGSAHHIIAERKAADVGADEEAGAAEEVITPRCPRSWRVPEEASGRHEEHRKAYMSTHATYEPPMKLPWKIVISVSDASTNA